jgi:hypothetical protein
VKPDKASQGRHARLVDLQRELATVAGFDPDSLSADERMRVEHAAVLRLQHETLAARVIGGQAVDTNELIRLNEVVAALLPPAKVAGPTALELRFVDPRLSRLSDSQLNDLERLLEELEGVEHVDSAVPLTAEQEAMQRRDKEIARLWQDRLALEQRLSVAVRAREAAERAVDELKATPPVCSESPSDARRALEVVAGAASHEPSGNVVPLPGSNSPWPALTAANAGLGRSSQCPGASSGPEYGFAPDKVDATGKRIPG